MSKYKYYLFILQIFRSIKKMTKKPLALPIHIKGHGFGKQHFNIQQIRTTTQVIMHNESENEK